MPANPMFRSLAVVLLAAVAASTAFAAEPSRPREDVDGPGGGVTPPPRVAEPENDLGCQVMLCLASPGSPTEFAECVDPMEKLFDRLRKGRSFPQCDMGGGESGNYAEQRGDYIDVYVDGQLYSSLKWRGGDVGTPPGGGGRDEPRPPQQQR